MARTLHEWIQLRVEQFARRQRVHPNAVRVLAEGDSWMTHGGFMWFSRSLTDQLNRYRTINLVSLAQPGDQLAGMVGATNIQWRLANHPDWLRGQAYDLVLFSGGGNDIVGSEFDRFLRQRSRSSRRGIDLVDHSALEAQLGRMRRHFTTLRRTVNSEMGSIPVLVHGYDYAIPSGRAFRLLGGLFSVGPWMQHHLIAKGITSLGEQQEIVNHLVDRFNELLADLHLSLDGFHHIDLRGTLQSDDWADELHPSARGRDKLARRLRADIVRLARLQRN